MASRLGLLPLAAAGVKGTPLRSVSLRDGFAALDPTADTIARSVRRVHTPLSDHAPTETFQ